MIAALLAPWQHRWAGWRDRLVADPRFQRRASAFWLTRSIARRRARGLFDLVAGFVYSQVLLACVRLRVFDLLAQGPLTAAQLAPRLQLTAEATERLLAAAVALRLLERRGAAGVGLGPLGAPMVGNAAIAAMVEHHGASLYGDLADPVALLRGTACSSRLADYWPYAAAQAPAALAPERVAAYSTLMSVSQPLVIDEVLDAYPLGGHRCLLDVGGGEGRFAVAAARRHSSLQVRLFDLPAVAQRAQQRFESESLAPRVQACGGDFLSQPLPAGADLVSLVRVVHDHDDARVLALLRSVRQSLPPHGRLLLAEPMAGTAGAEAMGDAYFGFYLLAMGRGRPRTISELSGLLQQAGFARVRSLPTRMPWQTGVLLAEVAPVSMNGQST